MDEHHRQLTAILGSDHLLYNIKIAGVDWQGLADCLCPKSLEPLLVLLLIARVIDVLTSHLNLSAYLRTNNGMHEKKILLCMGFVVSDVFANIGDWYFQTDSNLHGCQASPSMQGG
jgi:hypothetical protein